MMRVLSSLLVILTLAFLTSPQALNAGPHGTPAGPTITSAEWEGEVESGETQRFIIDAVDPRGAITEVIVDWGDNSISFAHTFCLQGEERGTPAHLILDHYYEQPGEYTVTVYAVSKPRCFSPSGTARESEPLFVDTFVILGDGVCEEHPPEEEEILQCCGN